MKCPIGSWINVFHVNTFLLAIFHHIADFKLGSVCLLCIMQQHNWPSYPTKQEYRRSITVDFLAPQVL